MNELQLANDTVAYASLFTGKFSLLLSILIGLIATILVFRAAKKMGGGLFGSSLNYIATGMTLVILGSLSNVLVSWFSENLLSVTNNVFFSLGYVFMVLGANKLLKGIINS